MPVLITNSSVNFRAKLAWGLITNIYIFNFLINMQLLILYVLTIYWINNIILIILMKEPQPIDSWKGIWVARTQTSCLQYYHNTEPGKYFVTGKKGI